MRLRNRDDSAPSSQSRNDKITDDFQRNPALFLIDAHVHRRAIKSFGVVQWLGLPILLHHVPLSSCVRMRFPLLKVLPVIK